MADDARPIQTKPRPVATHPGHWERRFTVDEFDQIGRAGVLEDAAKHELWDGRIVMAPVPSGRHSDVDSALFTQLVLALQAVSKLNAPFRVLSNAGIKLSEDNLVAPDVAVFLQRLERDQTLYGPGPVALAAEVAVSTLADDLGEKRTKYAAAEIPEYWVLDVAAKTVHVFRNPSRGDYSEHVEKAVTDTLSPLFETDIKIAIGDLF